MGDGFGRERGAHDDDSQIGPHGLPQADEHAEDEVHFDRAFVELIDHDGADVLERDIVEQPAQQDAGRHDDEPRIARDAFVESDLVADFGPEFAISQVGDSPGDGAGGESAGLDEDDPLVGRQVVEDGGRDEGCFARAGRGRDDDRAGARGGDDVGEDAGDGEVGK